MTEPTTLLETYIIRCGDAPAANGKIIEWKTAMDALDRLRRIKEAARALLDADEAYQHSDSNDADDGLLAAGLREARITLRAELEEDR